MTDAKTLLLELLAVIPDDDKCAALFAEDGVLELPFLYAVGIPTRHVGRTAIKGFYNFAGGKLYRDFVFKPQDIKVLIETPNQAFAEYTTHATAASTGRLIASLVRGTAGSRARENQATAQVARYPRRGTGFQPARRGRRPAAGSERFSQFRPATSVERRGSDE